MQFVFVLLSSPLRLSSVSVEFDFNASLSNVAPLFPIQLSVDLVKKEKSELLMDIICVLFLLCSRLRSSCMSVVFDFNTSLNAAVPSSLILLSVDWIIMKELFVFVDIICVLFLLCSQLRLSSVSVVFDFNASLNDVVPIFPMLFSVDLMRMEKSELLMDVIYVLFLLSLPTAQIEFCECCV